MTDLQRLAYRYVAERLAKGEINKRTAEQLRSRLRDFARHADVPPIRVGRRHVDRWLASRPELAAAYRRGRISALRNFCRWCVLNGYMRVDPTVGIQAPPVPDYLPRSLSEEESRAVVAACPDARTKVIAILMLQEGLRRVEVARMQMGDLDLNKRAVLVRGKGGQGRVTRRLPLQEETVAAIKAYLSEVGYAAGPFLRSKVVPTAGLSAATVGELIVKPFWESGVKQAAGDGKSGHALRHTCLTDMMDNGATTEEAQQTAGHASIRTTQQYTKGRVENLRDAMDGRTYT